MQVTRPSPPDEFQRKKAGLCQQAACSFEEFAVEMSYVVEKVDDYAP